MKNYQITQWCHHWIQNQVREGDVCIDATVGNGNDTEQKERYMDLTFRNRRFVQRKSALKTPDYRRGRSYFWRDMKKWTAI